MWMCTGSKHGTAQHICPIHSSSVTLMRLLVLLNGIYLFLHLLKVLCFGTNQIMTAGAEGLVKCLWQQTEYVRLPLGVVGSRIKNILPHTHLLHSVVDNNERGLVGRCRVSSASIWRTISVNSFLYISHGDVPYVKCWTNNTDGAWSWGDSWE